MAIMFAFATATVNQPPTEQVDINYACAWVRSRRSNPDPRRRADLRLTRHGSALSSRWTMSWPDGRQVEAEAVPAEFGSVGGSVGLTWRENEARKRAFISFSDLRIADGSTAFWLSMDRPSLWQPPGFACQSEPSRPGAAQ